YTTAPDNLSLCPIGNAIVDKPRKLTLFLDEFHTIPNAISFYDYVEVNTKYMPAWLRENLKWSEFQRPAQIDEQGNTNNVVIGDYYQPRIKLPGAAGIPDEIGTFYYIPNHEKKVFVEKLDFKSGFIRKGGKIFTDLGVFFLNEQGKMEVLSIHKGVTKEEILENTGCNLVWPTAIPTTKEPTKKEIGILNSEVDPDRLRYLETYPSKKRRSMILQIINQ
ncbi:hypothetical protein V7111_13670, partial [Neobacillus niacini]